MDSRKSTSLDLRGTMRLRLGDVVAMQELDSRLHLRVVDDRDDYDVDDEDEKDSGVSGSGNGAQS